MTRLANLKKNTCWAIWSRNSGYSRHCGGRTAEQQNNRTNHNSSLREDTPCLRAVLFDCWNRSGILALVNSFVILFWC